MGLPLQPSRWSTAHVDQLIACYAERQEGHVTIDQLRACGLCDASVRYRVSIGRLHRVRRGLYRIGPARKAHRADAFGAWLTVGQHSSVARLSAASLWKLAVSHEGDAHLLVRRMTKRQRGKGFKVHSFAAMNQRDRRIIDGLPVTSPALTILDCAADLSTRELERSLSEARSRNLVRPSHFADLRRRAPGRRGWAQLGALLADEAAPEFTRVESESRALELIRRAGLPSPRRNFKLGSYEADFYLPSLRLAIEIDGFGSHGGRTAFENDRERDADLASLGVDVRRLSWRQLTVLADQTTEQLRSYARHRAEAFGATDLLSAEKRPNP